MIAPYHPSRNLCGNCIAGLRADANPFGRVSDFNISKADNVVEANWAVASRSGEWAMNIFGNAAYLKKTTDDVFSYATELDQSLHQFDFMLGSPNDSRVRESNWFRERNLLRRALIEWDLDDNATQSAVYKGDLNSSTVDTSDGNELFSSVYSRPVISTASSKASVSGEWLGDDAFDSISIAIVDSGDVGTARYTWTYNGETSDPIDTHSVYSFLINGVKVKFTASSYTAGTDDFTIKIQLETTFLTDELANGKHYFKVATWRDAFKRISDETTSITIAAVPGTASLLNSTYTDGTGTAILRWRMPEELSVRSVEVFRNYPANGINDIHWRAIHSADIDAGNVLEYTVEGLQEGVNKVCVDVINDGERNTNRSIKGTNDNNPCFQIVLDASLNEITVPSKPWGVTATVESDGSITVTVSADSDSDSFELYYGTTSPDYSTVWATVANPQSNRIELQKIQKTGLFLPDGSYVIGCRAKSGTVVEENTDITYSLTVDTTPPDMAENLEATLSW